MGIDVDNRIQTQPSTYQLFKVLYLLGGNQENIEKDESFKMTVQNVKERQVNLKMQFQQQDLPKEYF